MSTASARFDFAKGRIRSSEKKKGRPDGRPFFTLSYEKLLRGVDCQRLDQPRRDATTIGQACVVGLGAARENSTRCCTADGADYCRSRISPEDLAHPGAEHRACGNFRQAAAA